MANLSVGTVRAATTLLKCNMINSYEKSQEDNKEKMANYTQWMTANGTSFSPAHKTTDKLTPGVYECKFDNTGVIFFDQVPIKVQGLIRFPDSESDTVVEEIQRFWTLEEKYNHYKLLYKRGILLYGPPGGGKTCTIKLIMEDVVSRGGIVINFNAPANLVEGMKVLRIIQPNTPVVIIMEDLDSIIKMFNESDVLNLLDGIHSTNKCVFLSTTNYPEQLGGRIINRPSRFDRRFHIGMPSAEARKVYIEFLTNGESILDVGQWVKDTVDFSVAHIKELFTSHIILGNDYKKVLNTLREMNEEKVRACDEKSVGFKI